MAAQAMSAGRVPGYSAVYRKQIDNAGDTVQYTKTICAKQLSYQLGNGFEGFVAVLVTSALGTSLVTHGSIISEGSNDCPGKRDEFPSGN